MAVLFADVRGSTSLAEGMRPSEFASLMNRFYQVAAGALMAQEAIIDKMVGDEVMALFIPGYSGAAYRRRAVEGALGLLRAVGYGSRSTPWLSVGAGAHAGPAFVGNVGSSGVTDFTALGDTVNTAARLQAEARPGEIVLSEALYASVADRYPAAEARTLALRGREERVNVRVLRVAERSE